MTSRKRGKHADQSVEDWLSERLDFELDDPPTEVMEPDKRAKLAAEAAEEAPTAPPTSAPRRPSKVVAKSLAAAPSQPSRAQSSGNAHAKPEGPGEAGQDAGLLWPNWQAEPLPEFQDPPTGPDGEAPELTAELLKGGDTRPLPTGMPLPIDAGPGLPSWSQGESTNSLLQSLMDTTAEGLEAPGGPVQRGPTTRPLPSNPDDDRTTGEVRPNQPTVPLPTGARPPHLETGSPLSDDARFDPPSPSRPATGLPPKVAALSAARANPRPLSEARPTEVLEEPPPARRPPSWSDAEDVHDAPTIFTNDGDGYIERALQELGPRPGEDIHDAPTMAISGGDNPAAALLDDPKALHPDLRGPLEPGSADADRPTSVLEEAPPPPRGDFSRPAAPDSFLFAGDDPANSPRTMAHEPEPTATPPSAMSAPAGISRAWLAWTGATVGLLLFLFMLLVVAAILWIAAPA
ncbi:MAG: hypothetical protein KTR31_35655 [Myxococcales bacterium]|nr:hypothetical protein [Myxococcales bacterium]